MGEALGSTSTQRTLTALPQKLFDVAAVFVVSVIFPSLNSCSSEAAGSRECLRPWWARRLLL
eukprot:1363100-Amphidinium_carterae.1